MNLDLEIMLIYTVFKFILFREFIRFNLMNIMNSFENDEKNKKLSRGEKRIRKALENFSFEKIDGINYIRFKKSKNVNFSIFKPEVFQSTVNESFLVFGEAKVEN